MRKGPPTTAEDVEGPWLESEIETGLVKRCRENWRVPVSNLSSAILPMFLRQKIALRIVIPEARRRLDANIHDDSELYDDELLRALEHAENA